MESEFLIAAIFSLLKISWKYLQYCMFPVGRLLKSRVKEIAASIGLGRIAKRKEVPDCCCVGPVSPLLFAKTTYFFSNMVFTSVAGCQFVVVWKRMLFFVEYGNMFYWKAELL